MADFQDEYGYGDDEPTVMGGEIAEDGYDDEYGYDDDYYDDYGGFDEFDEDVAPAGPLFTQAHTSRNLEMFAMAGSTVVAALASLVLIVGVLNKVYDMSPLGMPGPAYTYEGDPGVDAGVMSALRANDDEPLESAMPMPAPPELDVWAVSELTTATGTRTFAILGGRSVRGLYPGLMYYVPSPDNPDEPYNGLYLVVSGAVGSAAARADFCTVNEGEDGAGELTVSTPRNVYENSRAYISESVMQSSTEEFYGPAGFPLPPERRQPLLREIVDEAYALELPSTDSQMISVGDGDVRLPVDDPNQTWNRIAPAGFGQADLEGLNLAAETDFRSMPGGGLAIHGNSLKVRLAPFDKQLVLLDVLRVEYEDDPAGP